MAMGIAGFFAPALMGIEDEPPNASLECTSPHSPGAEIAPVDHVS